MTQDAERDVQEVRAVATVVTVVVTLLTVGVQAAVLKALQVEVELLQVLLRTAPLTLAVATCYLLWHGVGPRDDRPLLMLLLTTAVLLGSLLLSGWLGGVRPDMAIPREWWILIAPKQAINFIGGALSAYYRAYGSGTFVSSLILGVFLGWAWRKLWPHAAERITG
jgi:hypothetical protein